MLYSVNAVFNNVNVVLYSVNAVFNNVNVVLYSVNAVFNNVNVLLCLISMTYMPYRITISVLMLSNHFSSKGISMSVLDFKLGIKTNEMDILYSARKSWCPV